MLIFMGLQRQSGGTICASTEYASSKAHTRTPTLPYTSTHLWADNVQLSKDDWGSVPCRVLHRVAYDQWSASGSGSVCIRHLDQGTPLGL
jgi:hypothetical protein